MYPVIRNGEWIADPEKALPAWDRSYHFGDGLFETFRVIDGTPLFFERHLDRASRGLKRLGILPPDGTEAILHDIHTLLDHVGVWNARMRLTFSRKGGGAYTPYEDRADRLLELTDTSGSAFELPSKGDHVEVYEEMTKEASFLSPFKCTSAPLYVMAKRWAVRNDYGEALILSPEGRVLEAASSNLFMIRRNEILTPPVTDGCVDGVMRGVILDLAKDKGWKVRESYSPFPEELKDAEELLLSNAVQGIRPVLAFRGQRYYTDRAEELIQGLNERVPS